jgi:hypothetical protein
MTSNDLAVAPSTNLRSIRVWSPVSVAVCALLLGYPAGIVLAMKDWQALGLRREIKAHFSGALAFSIILIATLLLTPSEAGRIFGPLSSVMAFAYLKAKLRSDVEEFKKANPALSIAYRSWYAGLGWVLVGYLVFLCIAVAVFVIAIAVGIAIPD